MIKPAAGGPFPDNLPHPEKSGLFLFLNTNKQGITLNAQTATGIKIFKELLKWADVLIEDHAVTELADLGLSYDEVKKVNPSIIMTSITPFGPDRSLEGLQG